MTTTIDIADLDVVFLSYDEPKKDEFWVKIKNMIPWAVRVDGVKGSDAAHKAAATASQTDRFILIDGDNMPDPEFFNLVLEFPNDEYNKAVFRWRARNHINGLMYGNGGLSCWTKEFAFNMKTHEASTGNDETDVEFCFDPYYWPMHDCYSTTYPNQSKLHAWRAGFREGVKMCLNKGKRPSLVEFKDAAHKRNLDHLTIWHNVGSDVEFGEYAILGARQGTYFTMLTDWNYKDVQSFEKLNALFEKHISSLTDNKVKQEIRDTGEELTAQLGLPIIDPNASYSKFFKQHYRSNWHNKGVLVREIDVIREQEGW